MGSYARQVEGTQDTGDGIIIRETEADPKDWAEPDICGMAHLSVDSVDGMEASIAVLARCVAQQFRVVNAVQEFNMPDENSDEEVPPHIVLQHMTLKRLMDAMDGVVHNINGRFREMRDQQYENRPAKLKGHTVGHFGA